MTSARPASAWSSAHSAPVRSSKPYAKTGPALPGLELRGHALGCVAALQVAVPELEPIELGAVGPVQAGEVAFQVGRLDQAGLELAERAGQRIREAGEARRVPEPVERGRRDRGADDELPLGIGHHRPVGAAVAGEPLEEIVEGPDPAREERAAPGEELALDPLDVRPVGHDEHRIAVERVQVALEEQRNLAGVRRP